MTLINTPTHESNGALSTVDTAADEAIAMEIIASAFGDGHDESGMENTQDQVQHSTMAEDDEVKSETTVCSRSNKN